MNSLIPNEKIERAILLIRGYKVMSDSDLADIYGVKTKRLNEQVKRNKHRFPNDFIFQLTDKEKKEVVAKCDHLEKIKFASTNPFAFTEHGAIMLASVLNTINAIDVSIYIVRAFIKLREILSTHKELERKLYDLESKYDEQFNVVFKALKALMLNKTTNNDRRKIGYVISPETE